eukprot:Nitzschia sp. Nitz4//scaffold50_size126154//117748//119319//NITZ4_003707-RA/size126154-processed-gene-0.67-mRNA-1//-1//CDS//3329553764//8151//frame0
MDFGDFGDADSVGALSSGSKEESMAMGGNHWNNKKKPTDVDTTWGGFDDFSISVYEGGTNAMPQKPAAIPITKKPVAMAVKRPSAQQAAGRPALYPTTKVTTTAANNTASLFQPSKASIPTGSQRSSSSLTAPRIKVKSKAASSDPFDGFQDSGTLFQTPSKASLENDATSRFNSSFGSLPDAFNTSASQFSDDRSRGSDTGGERRRRRDDDGGSERRGRTSTDDSYRRRSKSSDMATRSRSSSPSRSGSHGDRHSHRRGTKDSHGSRGRDRGSASRSQSPSRMARSRSSSRGPPVDTLQSQSTSVRRERRATDKNQTRRSLRGDKKSKSTNLSILLEKSKANKAAETSSKGDASTSERRSRRSRSVDMASRVASSSQEKAVPSASLLGDALKSVDKKSGKKGRRSGDSKSVQSEAIGGKSSNSRRGRRSNMGRSSSSRSLELELNGEPTARRPSSNTGGDAGLAVAGSRDMDVWAASQRLRVEEERIRKLQQQARELEEKRLSEEMKLNALREEARMMQAKR